MAQLILARMCLIFRTIRYGAAPGQTAPFDHLNPVGDPALGQIVRRHFDQHFLAGELATILLKSEGSGISGGASFASASACLSASPNRFARAYRSRGRYRDPSCKNVAKNCRHSREMPGNKGEQTAT